MRIGTGKSACDRNPKAEAGRGFLDAGAFTDPNSAAFPRSRLTRPVIVRSPTSGLPVIRPQWPAGYCELPSRGHHSFTTCSSLPHVFV
jgi:hypothetical protein